MLQYVSSNKVVLENFAMVLWLHSQVSFCISLHALFAMIISNIEHSVSIYCYRYTLKGTYVTHATYSGPCICVPLTNVCCPLFEFPMQEIFGRWAFVMRLCQWLVLQTVRIIYTHCLGKGLLYWKLIYSQLKDVNLVRPFFNIIIHIQYTVYSIGS